MAADWWGRVWASIPKVCSATSQAAADELKGLHARLVARALLRNLNTTFETTADSHPGEPKSGAVSGPMGMPRPIESASRPLRAPDTGEGEREGEGTFSGHSGQRCLRHAA